MGLYMERSKIASVAPSDSPWTLTASVREQTAQLNSKLTYDRGAPPLPSAKVCLLSLDENVNGDIRVRKYEERRRQDRRDSSGVRGAGGHVKTEKQVKKPWPRS